MAHIIAIKYIIAPELKGRPIEFTKNSSNLDIRLTAPGMITPCTKPSNPIEIKKAFIAPLFVYWYFLK